MIRTPVLFLTTASLALVCAASAWSQIAPGTVAPPEVTILNAGAEPRRELRYRFTEGSAESAAMDIDMRLNMSMAGIQIQEMALPTIRMLVDLGPIVVANDGSARYDFEISSAELIENADTDPMVATALRTSLGQMPSFSGWARIDSRGATLDGEINLPGAVDQQLSQVFDSTRQSLQQMSAPLPAEPVGVGASWQLTQNVESGGFSVVQTATYTLVSRDGDDVVLDLVLTQNAPAQTTELPGMPPGLDANLDSLEASGTGQMQIDLRRFVPVADSTLDMAMQLSIAMQGQSQQIGMSLRMDLGIAPVE
jgi:hypothetical protein